MRWLGFAALVLVATTGCTVHVVERPAVPVLVAEPVPPVHRVHVAARPTYVRPIAKPPRARPPRPAPVEEKTVSVPREPRPKKIVDVRAQAPRHRTPQKVKRMDRFKLQPNDVAPIKDEPDEARRTTPARSTSVAKTQKNALDLRH